MGRISDDLYIDGTLSAKSWTIGAGAVGDAQAKTSDPFDVDKSDHQHVSHWAPNESADTPTNGTYLIHVAVGAGSVVKFLAGVQVDCAGDAEIAVDLQKNGASILTAAVTLDSAHGTLEGTIDTSALAAEDVLTIVVAVTAGTGTLGTGLWAQVVTNEAVYTT